MQAYKGAAGASGVAGMAQAMSGQAAEFARGQQMSLGQRAAEARRLSLQEKSRLQGQERQLMLQQDVGRKNLMLQEDRTRRDFDYGKMTTMLGVEGEQVAGARQMYASQLSADAQRDAGMMSAGGQIGGAALATKTAFICVPKGIHIDTVDGSIAIENIKPGDIVVGYDGKPVSVLQKHCYKEDPKNTFYNIKMEHDNKVGTVNVGGWHKVLNVRATDIKEEDPNVINKKEYKGVKFSYDLLTEDAGYRIDGIPVNSMIDELIDLATKTNNK